MMDKRLIGLVPEAMRHVLLTVVWKWLGLAGSVAFAYGLATVLGALLAGGSADAGLWLGVAAVGACVRAVAAHLVQRESFAATGDVRMRLRHKVYDKLLRLGPRYTEQVSTGEVVQLAVEGCEQLETYFGQYLPQLFYAVAAPLTLFFVVLPVSTLAAVVLLVFVPLIPVVIVIVQKVAKRILSGYWDRYANLADTFLESLQGLTTLKIYQADEARHQQIREESETFRKVTMKVLTMQLNSIIVMDVVALGGAAAGIAIVVAQFARGQVSAAGALLVTLLSAEFFIPMRQLGSYFHVAMNGMAAADKIFNLLALDEPERPERPAAVVPGDHFALIGATVSYDGERRALDRVDIDVDAVGCTAIVGESGSGKSTVAALMAGRLPSYGGKVLLGGKEVRDLSRDALARYLTVVPTRAYLFGGTVRENLLLAYPEASDGDLWAVLEMASLDDWVRGEDGLDTVLEPEGANLSGGQRQRLAIARALLHNSPVYVLDEATSNIDVESEEQILRAMRGVARYKAVVVISHRLAAVANAKRIYVLDKGHVVGVGTHDELLAGCARYRELWDEQQALESFGGGDDDA